MLLIKLRKNIIKKKHSHQRQRVQVIKTGWLDSQNNPNHQSCLRLGGKCGWPWVLLIHSQKCFVWPPSLPTTPRDQELKRLKSGFEGLQNDIYSSTAKKHAPIPEKATPSPKPKAKLTPSLNKQTPRQNHTKEKDTKKTPNRRQTRPTWCLWVCNNVGPQVLSDIESVGRKLSSLFGGVR